MLGGRSTVNVQNVCQDSLLAVPLILDLAIIAELCTRVEVREPGSKDFNKLYSVLSLLSYVRRPLSEYDLTVR